MGPGGPFRWGPLLSHCLAGLGIKKLDALEVLRPPGTLSLCGRPRRWGPDHRLSGGAYVPPLARPRGPPHPPLCPFGPSLDFWIRGSVTFSTAPTALRRPSWPSNYNLRASRPTPFGVESRSCAGPLGVDPTEELMRCFYGKCNASLLLFLLTSSHSPCYGGEEECEGPRGSLGVHGGADYWPRGRPMDYRESVSVTDDQA